MMSATISRILETTARYHSDKAAAEVNEAAAHLEVLQRTGANSTLISYAAHVCAAAEREYNRNLQSENRARAKYLWIG